MLYQAAYCGTSLEFGFCMQYVWSRKGALAAILVGLSPLSTLAALLTDLQSIRLLSGLAIAMAAVQLIHMRSVRQEGLRII